MSERSKGVVLIVDDEPSKRVTLQIELSEAGYTVFEAADASLALEHIKSRPIDVVVTDLRAPQGDGLRFLEEVKSTSPGTHVILMTAYGSIDSAVEAMRLGAADYLVKPFQTQLLLERLDWLRSSGHWPNPQDEVPWPERIGALVGRGYPYRQLVEQIRAAAANDRPVLVQGEDDAGNLEVAKTIHQVGPRSKHPLVCLSCAPGGPDDLEAELFGAAAGSASGQGPTQTSALARLHAAGGGTLLLNEVDGLGPGLQFKLLGMLEQAGYEHPDRPTGVDQAPDEGQGSPSATVRLVCATRRNLRALVEAGQFREDLYHRMGACRVTVPPLHGRREARGTLPDGVAMPLPEAGRGLTETIAGVERSLIDAALRRAAGNQAKAAQFLGIPRTTLRDKMAKYGMVGDGTAKGQPS